MCNNKGVFTLDLDLAKFTCTGWFLTMVALEVTLCDNGQVTMVIWLQTINEDLVHDNGDETVDTFQWPRGQTVKVVSGF